MQIRITYIQCIVNDESDGDEIYLKFQGKKIWPSALFKPIKTGEVLGVGVTLAVPFDEYICIELWEYDLLSKNDYLGVFKMRTDEVGGPFQTTLRLKNDAFKASYLLTWEGETY